MWMQWMGMLPLAGIGLVWGIGRGHSTRQPLPKEEAEKFRLTWLFPFSLFLIDKLRIMEKLPELTAKIHHKWLVLHGRSFAAQGAKLFLAEAIAAGALSLTVFALLFTLAGGEISLLLLGVLAAAVTPLLMIRELDARIRRKQQEMIIELPEFLSTMILLVNAGETVNRAWIRAVRAKPHKAQSPLYKELLIAVHELEMNASFGKVLEEFSKRCALHEISLFTSTLLLNHKRGGSEFVNALQALSLELWQRRKAVSRTLGEEASSKLVFPMVVIFIVVMVIVGSPALLIMNQ